jgi:hypothetical protein
MLNYTFDFGSIKGRPGKAQVIDHQNNRSYEFKTWVGDKYLFKNVIPRISSLPADLMDVAVAVYVADRLVERRKETPYDIQINLNLRNPHILGNPEVEDLLQNILFWYTNDYWHFRFRRRLIHGRLSELQSHLPFDAKLDRPLEVSLWSGGLDSLAGLFTRLSEYPSTYHILVGTGSNKYVHKLQKEVHEGLSLFFPNRTKLIQVPFYSYGVPNLIKNRRQRSRGFVFLLIGAIFALLEGSNSLYVYENGIGSFNLPYTKSEVGLDHARSVHPKSLLELGSLLSEILNCSFEFRNPFLYETKAQMCEELRDGGALNLIYSTISCDQPRRVLNQGILQCGFCTSCLLRRQAMAALGILDLTPYTNKRRIKQSRSSPLMAMLHQANRMRSLIQSENPWACLSKEYLELDEIVDLLSHGDKEEEKYIQENILKLYKEYAREWAVAQDIFSQSIGERNRL